LIDGEPVDGLNNRLKKLKAARKKELVEFIYITVTYKYDKPMSLGHKLTNRSGGKGTCSRIVPDSMMPVDQNGIRAEVLGAAVSIFNRMDSCIQLAIAV
jgi:DNA-directed RNA polymerase beta subunit